MKKLVKKPVFKKNQMIITALAGMIAIAGYLNYAGTDVNPSLLSVDSEAVEEASKYFRIGEKKLRKLAEENLDAGWVIVNGNRIQIKRKQFEKIIDTLDEI